MCQIFLGKNYCNTETKLFDIYAIRIDDEENNHSFPALL